MHRFPARNGIVVADAGGHRLRCCYQQGRWQQRDGPWHPAQPSEPLVPRRPRFPSPGVRSQASPGWKAKRRTPQRRPSFSRRFSVPAGKFQSPPPPYSTPLFCSLSVVGLFHHYHHHFHWRCYGPHHRSRFPSNRCIRTNRKYPHRSAGSNCFETRARSTPRVRTIPENKPRRVPLEPWDPASVSLATADRSMRYTPTEKPTIAARRPIPLLLLVGC
mmetsp:Transcript_15296/g.31386  ORF Transcript_15296/g.31386 Transcript_15296/m.31386 type:complete len:217 (+) Transcript_15296:2063-2713(+)